MPVALTSLLLLITLLGGCGDDGSRCGPSSATVTRIVDGDTVELQDKTKVRYLMIDTPESTGGADDCFGQEAADYNRDLVLDRKVKLTYDVECTDFFDRLLAYVEVDGTEVNLRMVEYGYACALYIPPNGEERRAEFENTEAAAKAAGRGMWGACSVVTCEQ